MDTAEAYASFQRLDRHELPGLSVSTLYGDAFTIVSIDALPYDAALSGSSPRRAA